MSVYLSGSVEKRLVGGEGIWTFLLADMALFAALFGAFRWYWHTERRLFEADQSRLLVSVGFANTIILLTSSWAVACAVRTARQGSMRVASYQITLAIVCALLFVGLKLFEYHTEIAAGNVLNTDQFFMFYYVLSGIHLVHVFIGLAVLTYLLFALRDEARCDMQVVESGAAFWHMVDVLWIFLFPILYLAR